jgi:hypothetical protein
MRILSVTLFLILAFSVLLARPGKAVGLVPITAYACEAMAGGNCASVEEPRHRERGLGPVTPGDVRSAPIITIGEAALLTFLIWLSHA